MPEGGGVRVRPCSTPGCPALVTQGARCRTHATTHDRMRGTMRERGYSVRWGHAAARFRRLYPLCGDRPNAQEPVMSQCRAMGRTTIATLVDHVVPHRGDPVKFWDEANWQSLCASCHSAKTRAGF